MESFVDWLMSESVESLTAYQPNNNIIAKNKIPADIVNKVYNLVSKLSEQEQIPYSQYLLGFYLSKSQARDEDYQRALENYSFYRKNKSSLYSQYKAQPFDLGKENSVIQTIKDNNFSNTRKKKLGKQLSDVDMSRVVTERFGDYTFYTIPASKNEQEKMNNKQLYCLLGKGTEWCTASPDGTYYEQYVDKLDITVIQKDGKPLYQFGLNPNGNIDRLCQFMDVYDNSTEFIPLDLYRILNKSKYKNILRLDQFDNMNYIDRLDLTNKEVQKSLIFKHPLALQLISNPSEEIKKLAVERNGNTIQFIENPDDKLQKIAVNSNGRAIEYIKNPSEEIQKIAVKQDGTFLFFIDHPTEEVKKIAVEENPEAIMFVNDPSEELQKIAVQRNGRKIRYIKNPSEETKRLAVQKDWDAIFSIKNPSEEVQKIVVSKNPYALEYIENPSEEIKKLAVAKNGNTILRIKDPSKEIQKIAVTKNWDAIKHIKNPDEEIQLIAIKQDPHAINMIKNPTDTVKELAERQS
jgi:uncharacterized membrane protein YecN with MAPEG domain